MQVVFYSIIVYNSVNEVNKSIQMEMKEIGNYTQKFNDILNLNIPVGKVFLSDGLKIHIHKRHPGLEHYISDLPQIIKHPDYVGTNPKEPNSIELVKILSDNVLVAIKLDTQNDYLYVASVYDITDSKLNNRINSGRLKKVVDK